MKIICVILFFSIIATSCSTTIYVVRHAEKQATSNNMMSADPELSDAGKKRALALADALASKKFTALYATPYKRTQQTAEPLTVAASLPIKTYAANKGEVLIDSLSNKKNKTYLVIGHSNTLLPMLRKLGLQPSLKEINDDDYDNLYEVRIKRFAGKKITLTEKTYGQVSP
ncbi:MAG: histidine phosphatase family protein [Bacteroidota bacterium]